ncbi:hypothetical protein HanRHA438_Chr06g0263511 [Helianthus annuus]|nr:hypothetical protein HanRHA438_Chr06g0263511 [Helianthus annuus]
MCSALMTCFFSTTWWAGQCLENTLCKRFIYIVMWSIWCSRNDAVFNDKVSSFSKVIEESQTLSFIWLEIGRKENHYHGKIGSILMWINCRMLFFLFCFFSSCSFLFEPASYWLVYAFLVKVIRLVLLVVQKKIIERL